MDSLNNNNTIHALKQLVVLEKDAENFGFAWENAEQIFMQILSEIDEIKAHLIEGSAVDKADLKEEIGDLFHAVVSLSLFFKFDPEEIIANSTAKFSRRMGQLKKLTLELGLENLHGLPFSELMDFWECAKKM